MKRAVLFVVLIAAPALADLSGHKWFAMSLPVPYRVFAHNTINGLPAGAFTSNVGGHGPVLGVVQDSFHEWTCFNAQDCRVNGTNWESTFTGTFTSPTGHAALNGMDSLNSVFWESGADWNYSMQTLGLTTTMFYPGTGQIIDADMELNNNVTWDDMGAPQAYDYPSVVLHEAGHFLGLNHTASQVAVMYAIVPIGATGIKRTLAGPDIQDVTTLYPSGQTLGGQGQSCNQDTDCQGSLVCRSPGDTSICTVDCTQGQACPAPLACQAANMGSACFTAPSAQDYCAFCTDGTQCLSGVCLSDGFGHNWCTGACTPDPGSCEVGSSCLDVSTGNACANGSGQCLCAPDGLKCPGQCSGTCPVPGFSCNNGTCEASGGFNARCETTGICGMCLMCIGDTSAAYCLTCCGGSTQDCNGCTAVTCADGAVCTGVTGTNDSVCVSQTGAGDCQACGGGTGCNNGETCVNGKCHASCNPQFPGTCAACAAEGATTGLCVCDSTEIHTEGQPCGVGTTVAACEGGLVCQSAKCARPCVVGDPNSCPSGFVCSNAGGTPACVAGSSGNVCDSCNGMQCNNGATCWQGRCYQTCNVSVPNGPCDNACIDVGGGLNVCACSDQIGGMGASCGASPVGACSSGLLCISSQCTGRCDPSAVNACPVLTACSEVSSGIFACTGADYSNGGGTSGTGGGGGGGGGGHHNGGGGTVGGGGGSDSGCGCGAASDTWALLAFASILRRRRSRSP